MKIHRKNVVNLNQQLNKHKPFKFVCILHNLRLTQLCRHLHHNQHGVAYLVNKELSEELEMKQNTLFILCII